MSNRGRPRTPTNILNARGAFEKNPQRKSARKGEPKHNGPLGDCPIPELSPYWDEISRIAPAGVLTMADRMHVEIAARLLKEMRESDKLNLPALRDFSVALGKMGLNPSERSKVNVAPEDATDDPWDKLLGAN